MRTGALIAITAAIVLSAAPATAQKSDDMVAAEQLFAEARALMERRDFAAACPKLEASFELDPQPGTALNLGRCLEDLGKLASAWAYYRAGAEQAARAGDRARERYARKRIAALEPRLSHLIIDAPSEPVPGLHIERNGSPVADALIGVAVYVDAGEHAITAQAPGYQPFSTTVAIGEGARTTVQIPVLARTVMPVRVIEPSAGTTAGAAAPPAHPLATRHDDGSRGSTGRGRRVMGAVAGSTGVAVMAAGLAVGWSAVSTWNEAFDSGLCERDTLTCLPAGGEQVDTANRRANLSTLLVGTGAALAVTGAVLYLAASRRSSRADTSPIAPIATPGGVGMAVSGKF